MRAELEGRESDRREARDALRASELAISAANRELLAQEAGARAARAGIGELAARRDAQERALEAQQDALGRLLAARAVAGLAGGTPDFVRVALSGEDLSDAARRLHYLTYVSREAAQLTRDAPRGLAELARLKADSEARAAELAALEARSRAGREKLLKEGASTGACSSASRARSAARKSGSRRWSRTNRACRAWSRRSARSSPRVPAPVTPGSAACPSPAGAPRARFPA